MPSALAASPETDRRDALVERLFEAVLGFNDLHAVYIGDRLGLYAALAGGASTPPEVATAAGCDERYVREWLDHQAVGGILEDPNALGLDAAFAALFLALAVPYLRDARARQAAALAAVITLVLTPFTPAGVPIIAASPKLEDAPQ